VELIDLVFKLGYPCHFLHVPLLLTCTVTMTYCFAFDFLMFFFAMSRNFNLVLITPLTSLTFTHPLALCPVV
jgi:hypothetical protein